MVIFGRYYVFYYGRGIPDDEGRLKMGRVAG
jgi:hypothetical protein